MTPVPTLTDEQRRENAQKAAMYRRMRAEFKRQLKHGKAVFSDAFRLDYAGRMRVRDLIASMPGYGKAKASQLMQRLGISYNRRVSGLGTRQREALMEVFGDVD